MIAGPLPHGARLPGPFQEAHHVAIGVEQAERRDLAVIKAALPSRLAQQVGGLKRLGL